MMMMVDQNMYEKMILVPYKIFNRFAKMIDYKQT